MAVAVLSGALLAVNSAMGLPVGPQAPPKVEEPYEQSRRPPSQKAPNERTAFDIDALTRRLFTPQFFAPWVAGVARVGLKDTPHQGFFCGATLIHPEWALTVAYCVDDFKPFAIELLYGADTLEDSKRAAIREIVVHPGYKSSRTTFENGLALLRLAEPLVREKISYPRIPSRPLDRSTEPADTRVVGWGSISERGPFSARLLQIDTTVIERDYCNSPTVYAGKIAPDMLCATAKLPGIDACEGFSGSGLISQTGPEPQLVGIVSWGDGCGRPNKPTVYSEISAHSEWIWAVIKAADR